jgi:hypothetical protein
MSIHSEAHLILKLYELRREPTLRQARDWFFRGFNPASLADYNAAIFSEHGAYVRMVLSYWDMAAALVNHGAISVDLFNDTNSEYVGVFAKVELIIEELRAASSPRLYINLEKLIDTVPHGRARTAAQRERMKKIQANMAAAQTK